MCSYLLFEELKYCFVHLGSLICSADLWYGGSRWNLIPDSRHPMKSISFCSSQLFSLSCFELFFDLMPKQYISWLTIHICPVSFSPKWLPNALFLAYLLILMSEWLNFHVGLYKVMLKGFGEVELVYFDLGCYRLNNRTIV